MPRRRSAEPTKLPELPAVALVWDGEAVARAMKERGLEAAHVAVVLGRHPSTIARWMQPASRKSSAQPPLDVATDVAAVVLGDPRRVTEFFRLVSRATGEPVRETEPLFVGG